MLPLSPNWIANWHRLTAVPVDARSSRHASRPNMTDAQFTELEKAGRAKELAAMTATAAAVRAARKAAKKPKPTATDRRYVEMQIERERYRGIGPIPDELL